MPRIRSLKPDLWQDAKICRLGRDARLLFLGMITQADDEGRMRASAGVLRGLIFPEDDLRNKQVQGWAEEIQDAGLARFYEVRGEIFAELLGWQRNQRVSHPRSSSIPPFAAHSREAPEPLVKAPESRVPDKDKEEDKEQTHATLAGASMASVWAAFEKHHPRAQLTPERRSLIGRRLKQFSPELLIAAIEGNHLSPYHNGENPSQQAYHDLGLILRNADTIERFAGFVEQAGGSLEKATQEELTAMRERLKGAAK